MTRVDPPAALRDAVTPPVTPPPTSGNGGGDAVTRDAVTPVTHAHDGPELDAAPGDEGRDPAEVAAEVAAAKEAEDRLARGYKRLRVPRRGRR